MEKYMTQAGIELTAKQNALVNAFDKLMKRWEKDGKDLSIRAIAGTLTIMLAGDTKQNPEPELSDSGGFNQDNIVKEFNSISADGGDW